MISKRHTYQGFLAHCLPKGPHSYVEKVLAEGYESLSLHGPLSPNSDIILSPALAREKAFESDRDPAGINVDVFGLSGYGIGPFSIPAGEVQQEMNRAFRSYITSSVVRMPEIAERVIPTAIGGRGGEIGDLWQFCNDIALSTLIETFYGHAPSPSDVTVLRRALLRRSMAAGVLGAISFEKVGSEVFSVFRNLETRARHFRAIPDELGLPAGIDIVGLDPAQTLRQLTTGMIAVGPGYFWSLYYRDVVGSDAPVDPGIVDGMPLVSPPRIDQDKTNVVISPYAVARLIEPSRHRAAFGPGAHHCPASGAASFIVSTLLDNTPELRLSSFDPTIGAMTVSKRPRRAVRAIYQR